MSDFEPLPTFALGQHVTVKPGTFVEMDLDGEEGEIVFIHRDVLGRRYLVFFHELEKVEWCGPLDLAPDAATEGEGGEQ